MRRFIIVSTLVLLAVITGGCIVSIGSKGHKHPHEYQPHEKDIVISEIDAASRLFSDSDKADVYKDIARRPDLSSRAQVYLVNAVFSKLFAESSKEQVLLILIENPCFDDAGKRAVLSKINRLFADSSKKRILKAFNDKQNQTAQTANMEVVTQVTVETVENSPQ